MAKFCEADPNSSELPYSVWYLRGSSQVKRRKTKVLSKEKCSLADLYLFLPLFVSFEDEESLNFGKGFCPELCRVRHSWDFVSLDAFVWWKKHSFSVREFLWCTWITVPHVDQSHYKKPRRPLSWVSSLPLFKISEFEVKDKWRLWIWNHKSGPLRR